MKKELTSKKSEEIEDDDRHHGGSSEAVYGLGIIGAWVYYIGRASTFREGAAGFFKALVWPAILVYRMLEFFEKE